MMNTEANTVLTACNKMCKDWPQLFHKSALKVHVIHCIYHTALAPFCLLHLEEDFVFNTPYMVASLVRWHCLTFIHATLLTLATICVLCCEPWSGLSAPWNDLSVACTWGTSKIIVTVFVFLCWPRNGWGCMDKKVWVWDGASQGFFAKGWRVPIIPASVVRLSFFWWLTASFFENENTSQNHPVSPQSHCVGNSRVGSLHHLCWVFQCSHCKRSHQSVQFCDRSHHNLLWHRSAWWPGFLFFWPVPSIGCI